MRRELIHHSKFLSLVLRHDPSVLGLSLDESGRVEVKEMLAALRDVRPELDQELLLEIVETNEKKRFAFSQDRLRIRASQGHSIGVDLGLPPVAPPQFLFHGTAKTNLALIFQEGLKSGQRDFVHLSIDQGTAHAVGARHGHPAVIRVQSGVMHTEGHTFFVSDNMVWLTEYVPIQYLERDHGD